MKKKWTEAQRLMGHYQTKILVMRVLEDESEKGANNIFEGMVAKSSPNLMKNTHLHI